MKQAILGPKSQQKHNWKFKEKKIQNLSNIQKREKGILKIYNKFKKKKSNKMILKP